jgi:cell division protease FtsH
MIERDPTSRREPPKRPPSEEPDEGDAGERRVLFGLMFVLLVMLAAVGVNQLGASAPLKPYHEFKQRLREGRVSEAVLTRERVRWKMRSDDARRTQVFESVRVDDEQLVPLLEEKHVRYAGQPEVNLFQSALQYALIAVGLMLLWRAFARRMQSASGGLLAFGRSRARAFGERDVSVRFEDVAGVDEAKEELREVVEFLRNAEKFTRIGAKIPKGVLLVGPPGTGKTLLARAVAGEAGVTFYSISGSEFVEMFVGVGAARVRDLFEAAQQHAPCIVFIDELDALGRSRGANVLGTNEEREQTLNQLLVEMDGFAANKGVIVLAATNRPEILDPALLRPGRFDRQVLVDRPDRKGREAILRVHARGIQLVPGLDLGEVAARTPGFAGADLANILNEAALLAARKDKPAVTMADIEEAIERVASGLERRSRLMSSEERRRVAYHEVGHAIVGEVLPGGSRVVKISIVPRGVAALGYTMKLPTEDRYLMTESELRAQLASLLGGRVAEQIVFGEVSTGAGNDLQQATELAQAMVVDFGMSRAIGPVALGHERRAFLQGNEPRAMRAHGDAVADMVDAEVKRIVEEAERTAREVLTAHRDRLEAVAAMLLEREHLEGEEFRALLAGAAALSPPGDTVSARA